MYAWSKFHGSSPYSFRENDLNIEKFTPPTTTTTTPPEKQYICLASASQARQKCNTSRTFNRINIVIYFRVTSQNIVFSTSWGSAKTNSSAPEQDLSVCRIACLSAPCSSNNKNFTSCVLLMPTPPPHKSITNTDNSIITFPEHSYRGA